MNAVARKRIEAEPTQVLKALHHAGEGPMTQHARGLADPGQPAQSRPGVQVQEPVQCHLLVRAEAPCQLLGDVTFGLQHGGRRHALHHARTRNDDPAAAQLVGQQASHVDAARRGQRHWQEPSLKLRPSRKAEVTEAEGLPQRRQLVIAGRLAHGIAGQGGGVDAELLGHEGEGGGGNEFAGTQEAPGVA